MSSTATSSKITIDEAAEEWGCSNRTIRRMIARGTVPGYRVGPRLLRVDRDELAQAMRVVPTGSAA